MSLLAERQARKTTPIAARFPQIGYKRQLALMLVPYVLGLVGLVLLPALLSIPFAFTDYNALRAPDWIGLGNFSEMLGDRLFWNGLGASLFYIVLAVPLRVFGAVFLAFLLHKPTLGNKINRVIAYLPTLIPDVAYALLWLYIFNPLYGPLNWILRLLGANPESWLLEPWPAKFAIVIMMLWPIGEGFVLMLAAFNQIPHELGEAAQVDGASGKQRFLHITLPLLAPAILLLLFRDTVFSFQANFVPGLITTGGGPYNATRFLPIYIWENAAEFQRFGYAAAMTWVMYGITAAIIALQFVAARRWRNLLYD
ncbi:MAG TPA: sugar ABC transporter permease [Chloroflexia bacterium]